MWIFIALQFIFLQLIGPALLADTNVVPWWDGGRYDADITTCPCCVSLRDEHGHFATGVIIDESVIVSVQHHRLTGADQEVNVTVVVGTDILDSGSETMPIRIFLVRPDGPAQYTHEEDARIALWTLMEPLQFNDTIKACPRFESTRDQETPSKAVMKGWILDGHGNYKNESRKLKNYQLTTHPMKECGIAPEDIFFCATMEPKEVNCFGRMGNPVFTRNGTFVGFQTMQTCANCECSMILRIGVTDKRVRRAREKTKKVTSRRLVVV